MYIIPFPPPWGGKEIKGHKRGEGEGKGKGCGGKWDGKGMGSESGEDGRVRGMEKEGNILSQLLLRE